MTIREIFAARLREALELKGCKQQALADHLEVDVRTVRSWAGQESFPRDEVFQKLADFLDQKPVWFLSEASFAEEPVPVVPVVEPQQALSVITEALREGDEARARLRDVCSGVRRAMADVPEGRWPDYLRQMVAELEASESRSPEGPEQVDDHDDESSEDLESIEILDESELPPRVGKVRSKPNPGFANRRPRGQSGAGEGT